MYKKVCAYKMLCIKAVMHKSLGHKKGADVNKPPAPTKTF